MSYVMGHLLKYKGKGPCRDVYEHYQAMPACFVHDLCVRALNGWISECFTGIWQSGLLHVGDKQRLNCAGQKDGRHITVGLVICQIACQILCAQLMYNFAGLFAKLRQLSIAVPSGIKVAFHTVQLAVDCMQQLADSDNSLMLTPLKINFSDAFTRVKQSLLFCNMEICMLQLL